MSQAACPSTTGSWYEKVGKYSSSSALLTDTKYSWYLQQGIQKSPLGGALLTNYLASAFRSSMPPIDLRPHYLVKEKLQVAPNTPARATIRENRLAGTTESYARHTQGQILQDFKESVLQVYETPYDDKWVQFRPAEATPAEVPLLAASGANARPPKPFEFPDGFNTFFGALRYRVPEVMFNPSAFLPPEFTSLPSTSTLISTIATPPLSQAQSFQNLVLSALRANDIDLHPTLLQNIVVVGGTTLMPGFLDRLQYELSRLPLGNAKPKIEAPGNVVARKYSSWLGGSILASLGTFHQLWIGREEYMEVGKGVVHRRARWERNMYHGVRC